MYAESFENSTFDGTAIVETIGHGLFFNSNHDFYGSAENWVTIALLILTAANALARAVSKLCACEQKWRHRRYYALMLDGQIWRYRTRVDKYAISVFDEEKPLRTFAAELKARRLFSEHDCHVEGVHVLCNRG